MREEWQKKAQTYHYNNTVKPDNPIQRSSLFKDHLVSYVCPNSACNFDFDLCKETTSRLRVGGLYS